MRVAWRSKGCDRVVMSYTLYNSGKDIVAIMHFNERATSVFTWQMLRSLSYSVSVLKAYLHMLDKITSIIRPC
jgi:hypothetical protein